MKELMHPKWGEHPPGKPPLLAQGPTAGYLQAVVTTDIFCWGMQMSRPLAVFPNDTKPLPQPAAICNNPLHFQHARHFSPQMLKLVSPSLAVGTGEATQHASVPTGRERMVAATAGMWGSNEGSGTTSPALKLPLLSAIILGKKLFMARRGGEI